MADQQMSQEEMLAQQKAQCPFCKIVAGEIPSTKVYEDDKVLAIMDINPVVPGHVLLLPKEHYPILPLVPPHDAAHMFKVARDISRAQKKAVVTNATNVFIANGGAAGQQAQHFMMHVIPREPGDALSEVLRVKAKEDIDQNQQQQIGAALKHNMGIAVGNLKLPDVGQGQPKQQAAPTPQAPPVAPAQPSVPAQPPLQSQVDPEQKKKLAARIESDAALRNALIADPKLAEELIAKDSELLELTKGVDIQALHQRLKAALGGAQE